MSPPASRRFVTLSLPLLLPALCLGGCLAYRVHGPTFNAGCHGKVYGAGGCTITPGHRFLFRLFWPCMKAENIYYQLTPDHWPRPPADEWYVGRVP